MTSIALASVALATTILFIVLLGAVPNVAFEDYVIFSDESQSLFAGQNLTFDLTSHRLPFGPYSLNLGHDCNLVLYSRGNRIWSSNTTKENGQNCYLTLLPNGELVLRNNIHYPVWRSGVKSTPGNYAFILNYAFSSDFTFHGAFEVVGPELWTNTQEVRLSETIAAPTSIDSVYYSGQTTMATYGVLVTYKNFRLLLRQDCNLVLEDMNTWEVFWETATKSNSGDCFTTLDSYGELFVKHNRREVLWRSGKRSTETVASALVLRFDGRLIIYRNRIWKQPPESTSYYVNKLPGLMLPK